MSAQGGAGAMRCLSRRAGLSPPPSPRWGRSLRSAAAGRSGQARSSKGGHEKQDETGGAASRASTASHSLRTDASAEGAKTVALQRPPALSPTDLTLSLGDFHRYRKVLPTGVAVVYISARQKRFRGASATVPHFFFVCGLPRFLFCCRPLRVLFPPPVLSRRPSFPVVLSMPKVKSSRKVKFPKGWEVLQDTLAQINEQMREGRRTPKHSTRTARTTRNGERHTRRRAQRRQGDAWLTPQLRTRCVCVCVSAENMDQAGKRKDELLWPIFRLHHQRSRYIWSEEKHTPTTSLRADHALCAHSLRPVHCVCSLFVVCFCVGICITTRRRSARRCMSLRWRRSTRIRISSRSGRRSTEAHTQSNARRGHTERQSTCAGHSTCTVPNRGSVFRCTSALFADVCVCVCVRRVLFVCCRVVMRSFVVCVAFSRRTPIMALRVCAECRRRSWRREK